MSSGNWSISRRRDPQKQGSKDQHKVIIKFALDTERRKLDRPIFITVSRSGRRRCRPVSKGTLSSAGAFKRWIFL
jgi:hypothetical protein